MQLEKAANKWQSGSGKSIELGYKGEHMMVEEQIGDQNLYRMHGDESPIIRLQKPYRKLKS